MFRISTALAILVLGTATAQAGDVTLHFGDLDLSSARDTGVLAGRVHSAAGFVCEAENPQAGQNSMFYRQSYERCLARAARHLTAEAMASSGRPRGSPATKFLPDHAGTVGAHPPGAHGPFPS